MSSFIRYPYIVFALKLVRSLAIFGSIFSLFILASYFYGIEELHRPLKNGSGTHPLTAISIFSLGVGIYHWRPYTRKKYKILCCCTVTGLLSLTRLLEITTGQSLLLVVTPFTQTLNLYASQNKTITMGGNTAVMLLLFTIALISVAQKKHFVSQITAFIGLGVPWVSLIGYAYGLDKFYGQMALSTALLSLPVGYAIMFADTHRSIVLRAILSSWIGGKIARLQIMLGFSIPFLIGYLLIHIALKEHEDIFGLFVVLIGMFIAALITYSAIYQEQVDASRRSAERKLHFFATIDPLTSTWNRRFLFDSASSLLEHSRAKHEKMAVLMLDIDHFKHVNDAYGHAVGDRVLKELAQQIKQLVRSQDVLARYGGEEFVILLPHTDLAGARILAENIRKAVESYRFTFDQSLKASISVGCIESQSDENLEKLISRADSFLYQAKQNGRNQVAG